jgi:hypothetical protein
MKEYLKGNYKITKEIEPGSKTDQDGTEQEFYRRSLEKLGGSIAFVLKSKNLLWKGNEKKSNSEIVGNRAVQGTGGSDTPEDR